MDSKTYIRACALFMFDQDKSTKEASRLISELYPEDVMTERTCERWFAKFREGDRSLQDLKVTFFEGNFRRSFRRDKPRIGNQVRMLSANNNQRITSVDYFSNQTN